MSKTICSKCRYAIQDVLEMFCMRRKLHTKDGLFVDCCCFSPKSVFHRITQSTEMLAEKLVYLVRDGYNGAANYYWCSTVTDGMWKTKQEAVAATVAKLEEVYNK